MLCAPPAAHNSSQPNPLHFTANAPTPSHPPRFALYNVLGACIWTFLFVGAGFFFGNLPVVQHNFTLVVLGIVAISVLPVAWELYQARREGGGHGGSGDGAVKAS